MGTVYLGVHEQTSQIAAVKVLPAAMAREPGFVARFDREIAAMKKLSSESIVELYESGEADETFYYAMEYVEGETLTDRLDREVRIPWHETIAIGVQICTALKAAHNAGIIHRDLKPSNLLISKDGKIKLTDFGVAQIFATNRLTATGGVLGTAEYMSPEQAAGKRATKQSDIYSLGAVLYVMLTGRPPFRGKTVLEIIQKHKYSQFDSVKRLVPEVPYWLDEIVCTCLAKRPEDRYPDAYVLSLRLQEVPKKVDLSSQQDASRDSLGTDETLADQPSREEMGGTFARDLFRIQIEAEKAKPGLSRLFDNTWVLLGLLAILLLGGYGWHKMRQLTDEQRFERGVELMAKPEGAAWDMAQADYFEPLLRVDEDRWRPKIANYLDQIELYQLKKQLLGREFNKQDIPNSEPSGIIQQAMEARRRGDFHAAMQMLLALRPLLAGDERYQVHLRLVDDILKSLLAQASQDQLDFVTTALDRADELFEKGDKSAALEIWLGVKNLYDQHPAARTLVERAEQNYQSATGIDIHTAESPLTFQIPDEMTSPDREHHGPEVEDPQHP